MSRHIVAWDKDGTIADTSHRHWMVKPILAGLGSPLNPRGLTWQDYARACTDDKPNEAARELMNLMAPHYEQYVLSGSNECPEGFTWLRRHRFPYSRALFRQMPADDHLSNAMIKVKQIRELQSQGYRVRLFVEDFASVAKVIETETRVPCLVLNPRLGDGYLWGDELASP